jgi:hypothetical protein
LRDRLKQISLNPSSVRLAKPLVMGKGKFSCRVGGWRIIYLVSQAEKIVFVEAINPLQNAYSKLWNKILDGHVSPARLAPYGDPPPQRRAPAIGSALIC